MSQYLLVGAVALTVGAIVFGISVLITGDDKGLRPAEPDGQSAPLPVDRPLVEADVSDVRFDTALRGYRMAQVDAALRRLAYDLGYKEELIKVLRAEVDALREGRNTDAETLRRAREAAAAAVPLVEPAADEQGEPLQDEPLPDEPPVVAPTPPAPREPEQEPDSRGVAAIDADEPAAGGGGSAAEAEEPAVGESAAGEPVAEAEKLAEAAAEDPAEEPAEEPAEASEEPAGTGRSGRR